MTWKAVGPVVQKVVSRIVDVGESGVDAPAQPPKRTASNAPAAKSFRETVVREAETTLQITPTIGVDRRTGEHPQLGHAPAPLVRRSMLTVIEGGRTTQGRKLDRPAYRDGSWRERARETGLVLVHSAAS
jgi:hypothetical protein